MKVSIIGSCVTRDAFALGSKRRWTVTSYFARTSLASAMSARAFDGVDTSGLVSDFQRRIVDADLEKTLPGFLATDESDLTIYDPIDERFDLLQRDDGAICTYSSELARVLDPVGSARRIRTGSADFFALWERGWCALLAAMDARGRRSRLRINMARWAERTETAEPFGGNYPPERVLTANLFLDRLYSRMRLDLPPWQFMEPESSSIVGNASHKWGLSPFHFVDAYYLGMLRLLDGSVPASSDEAVNLAAAPAESGSVFAFGPETGTRHVADVRVPIASARAIELDFALSGWDDFRYVAVGFMSGGSFFRIILSGLELDRRHRLRINVEALLDGGGNCSPSPVEGIDRIRLYVVGEPRQAGAEISVSRVALLPDRTNCLDVDAESGRPRTQIDAWHPRYQLPVVFCESRETFCPAVGMVAIYVVPWLGRSIYLMADIRQSDRLVVGFHGAANRAMIEYPYFSWVTTRKGSGESFLLICDPTLVVDADMTLGWYLGDKDNDLVPVLVELVRRMRLAADSVNVAFTGGSGGGFAALQVSRHFDDSIALVFAPQTELARYDQVAWSSVCRNVFDDLPGVEIEALHGGRVSVIMNYRSRQGSNLVDFVINVGDDHHLNVHCVPFAGLFGVDVRGGISADQRVRILPVDLGIGHLPVPRELHEVYLDDSFERLSRRRQEFRTGVGGAFGSSEGESETRRRVHRRGTEGGGEAGSRNIGL